MAKKRGGIAHKAVMAFMEVYLDAIKDDLMILERTEHDKLSPNFESELASILYQAGDEFSKAITKITFFMANIVYPGKLRTYQDDMASHRRDYALAILSRAKINVENLKFNSDLPEGYSLWDERPCKDAPK